MKGDLHHLLDMLDKMAQLELVISGFYQTAAEAFPEDAAFWKDMAKAEVRHAGYLKQIEDILKRKPQEFETGRALNMTATDFFIANVKKSREQLKNGKFNKRQLLFTALDLEQSILESKYPEILKSHDVEYQTLIAEISQETLTHKDMILDKIEANKS